MSNQNSVLLRIGEAIEELRRAFAELATETEISIGTAKQLRREIGEGIEREAELRNLLRDRGLASYQDETGRPNHDPSNS